MEEIDQDAAEEEALLSQPLPHREVSLVRINARLKDRYL